jgi:hypothetical protein
VDAQNSRQKGDGHGKLIGKTAKKYSYKFSQRSISDNVTSSKCPMTEQRTQGFFYYT